MKLKKLPIGLSDFKEIIERNYYYIDKSLFIQDIIDSSSKVSLITRPRRFGKTTNLSMLQYFFERYEGSELKANTQQPTANSQHPIPNPQRSPIPAPEDMAVRRRIHRTLW